MTFIPNASATFATPLPTLARPMTPRTLKKQS